MGGGGGGGGGVTHLSISVHHSTSSLSGASFPETSTGSSPFLVCLMEFALVVMVWTLANCERKHHELTIDQLVKKLSAHGCLQRHCRAG